jgi:hypothetical protein
MSFLAYITIVHSELLQLLLLLQESLIHILVISLEFVMLYIQSILLYVKGSNNWHLSPLELPTNNPFPL